MEFAVSGFALAALPETFWGWVLFVIRQYGPLFLTGARNTLLIAITGTAAGFLIGLLVAIVRTFPLKPATPLPVRSLVKFAQFLLTVYIEVFRGTPMIVQAMVLYYGSSQLLGWNLSAILAGVLIVSINTGAYMAEIIRGGIDSIDRGQAEAAQAIGMNHVKTMVYVILPQAIRNILPATGNELVVNIKDTSVLNVISVTELFFMSKSAAGTYLRYFEVFFVTSVIYLILTFTVTRLLRLLEKKLDGPDNYTIMGSQTTPDGMIHVHHGDGSLAIRGK
ncbi:MAG: amino acid ABC transporter permease [Clostridia bacterium]|nr:amino acid ABC transporter permease [Clostridia bacterium]NCC75513.1 amino acid ABC transporter permease [Clostridia bacterium]